MTPSENDSGLPVESTAYKWAATFGISTIFAIALLWIVYIIAIQGQKSLSDDVQAMDTKVISIERKSDTILEDHKMFREIFLSEFKKLTKVMQQSCLNTAKTTKALQDCIAE